MDIASAANIQSVNLASEISVRVARTALDASKQEGEAAVALIQAAAAAGKQMAADNGLGGRMDMSA